MRIKFTGYMDIAPEDVPDDRGSIGHWLINLMEEASTNTESTDEAFEALQLSWEIV